MMQLISLFFIFTLSLSTSLDLNAQFNIKSMVFDQIASIDPTPVKSISRRELPKSGIVELKFENGITFTLLSLPETSNQVKLEAFALGGSSSFDRKGKVICRLAPYLSWESKLDEIDPPDLSDFLTSNSLSFSTTIRPYYRRVKGSCYNYSLELFFKYAHLFFKKSKIDQEGMRKGVTVFKEVTKKKSKNIIPCLDSYATKINSLSFEPLKPVSSDDLSLIEHELAEKVWESAIGDLDQFYFVLTGNFDLKRGEELAEKYIGTLVPRRSDKLFIEKEESAPFPKGETIENVACGDKYGSLVRVSFPIISSYNPESYFLLDFSSFLIEEAIREHFKLKHERDYGANVTYEFPLYPNHQMIWFMIQFRTDEKTPVATAKEMVEVVQNFIQSNPSELDLSKARILSDSSFAYWSSKNIYWISLISNFYRWKWDLTLLEELDKIRGPFESEKVLQFLKSSLLTDQYTIIYTQ